MSSEHRDDTYRSMLAYALEALRSLLLLNGAAVVALLAYLGQLGPDRAFFASHARVSIGLFVAGVIVAMVAMLAAYMTHHALFNEEIGNPQRVRHELWQWTTVGVAALSLVLFSLGAFAALNAFAAAAPPP
jgi:hypothetical protein